MIKLIESLMVKLCGNTKGYDFNMWDWDVSTLQEKYLTGQLYTDSELHAIKFLEEIRRVLDKWDPPQKWKRPYGEVLNEQRKLH